MLDAIIEDLIKGAGISGVIIGILAVLGMFLVIVGLLGYIIVTVFSEDEQTEEAVGDDDAGDRGRALRAEDVGPCGHRRSGSDD